MRTKHLVDPDLLAALDLAPNLALSVESLPPLRAAMAEMGRARAAETVPDVTLEERGIAGRDSAPDVRILILSPAGAAAGGASRPAYLHMHGGGYVLGTAEMSIPYARTVVRQTGATVVSVDYRLAPETPFPGAIEDCYAALAWLHDEADTLGIDRRRIAIGGDSAGGGLAAALALLARDRAEYPVCFQVLNYPMIDDRTVTAPDPHPVAGEYIWDGQANRFGWQSLLGQAPGADGVSPHAAAARETDLGGLPPAFVGVGALDLFIDENIDYARRLMRAGVPVELHVYPGAYHGFDLMVEGAEISRRYRRDLVEALSRALAAR